MSDDPSPQQQDIELQLAWQRERNARDNAVLLTLAPELPEDLKVKLLAIHDGLYCAARNEGLNCCLDFLLGTWGP